MIVYWLIASSLIIAGNWVYLCTRALHLQQRPTEETLGERVRERGKGKVRGKGGGRDGRGGKQRGTLLVVRLQESWWHGRECV